MYPGSSPKFLESFVHLCFIMRNSFLFDLAGPESLNKFCFLACTWCEPLPRTPHRLSVLSHSSARVSSLLSCHCALCLMLCKLLLLGYFPCTASLASTIYSAIHLPFSDVLLPVFWGSGEGQPHLKTLKVPWKLSRSSILRHKSTIASPRFCEADKFFAPLTVRSQLIDDFSIWQPHQPQM